MNIIIPIGNLDEEFQKYGYSFPKPLVYVKGKHMIYWLLESLLLTPEDKVFILYTSDLDTFHFKDTVSRKINCVFIPIPYQTRDVVETIIYGMLYIPEDRYLNKTLIIDCDNYYQNDIIKLSRETTTNALFYKINKDKNPIYSYLLFDDNNKLVRIEEKQKISDYANIGIYVFMDIYSIKKFIKPTFIYLSEIYKNMIQSEEPVYVKELKEIYSMGTPLDIHLFPLENKCRICFDLDNTLVSYPTIENDYTTVLPNYTNISFLRYLKYLGNTIIIYTARRMKTHKGNTGKVLADIGKITFDTLEKFNIPFDEIYFGKPEADFYIDDKAINAFSNLERETGFHNITISARDFNQVKFLDNTVIKSSLDNKLKGEIYWYKNCPEKIRHLFPKLFSYTENSYVIDKINGVSLSYIFTQKNLDNRLLDKIITNLEQIHSCKSSLECNVDVKDLYKKKLIERYKHPLYSKLENSEEIFNYLIDKYDEYSLYEVGIMHGDSVLSNILLTDTKNLVFIDMRGIIGDTLTIYGDINYDFAKLYQSLSGYDFIMKNQIIPIKYTQQLLNKMSSCFNKERWKWIKILSLGLYFTLLPLHNEDVVERMYGHILNLYEEFSSNF